MLAIRMQRTGRKGHAMFRVVVQESRLTPTSGRVVATIGSYDPHTKQATLAKDKAEYYLTNGAQPSDRAARLLQKEGVKLPKWVKLEAGKKRELRNPEKLRKNQPKEEPTTEKPAEPEAPAAEAPTESDEKAETEA
ncbi:MAG TPA: 30S ribosomal protein S16 [Candidatus Saccharimonadales bacterium]|nr:30S ribosomal protein S16 [Candidatus Saccharimonadales bacterium]